jgi:MFS family permease
LFIPITFIVSFASAHGQGGAASYTPLSLLNAGSVLGRFIPGLLADKFGRFNVIIVTLALCCSSLFGLWLPAGNSKAMVVSFALLFGFASGSNLGLVPVCLGQLCDSREYARFVCTAMMTASFGSLSSVPIGGTLLGAGGEAGWTALILFSGTSYTLALICYIVARALAVGWEPKRKF